jgi:pyruvate dehydrogenase E2 component (dihydrolipoamide acetyltransferase)
MTTDILMPTLSDTMEEGTLLRWLKKPGDEIQKGDALAEVETDKATMEIEAFETGTLLEILVEAGETIPIGEPIARIGAPDETKAAVKTEVEPEAEAEAPEKTEKKGKKEKQKDLQKAKPSKAERKQEKPDSERVKASPLARKMASAYEIDLRSLQGSGPGGRIVERDVDEAIGREKKRPTPPPPPPSAPAQAKGPSRMRQAIAQRMSESKRQAPHFYVTLTVQADALVGVKKELNALEPDPKVSYTHLLVLACVHALQRHPRLNARYEGGEVFLNADINIGVATAVEDGLLVPVLHQLAGCPLGKIAAESQALQQRVQEGRLKADDLAGGTFTLSNMGMYGVESFSAIINPPQAAILAVGALEEVPVVRGGQVTVGHQMKLTLSADHRVVNGAEAAEFLQELCRYLEHPLLMLA